MEWNYKSKIKSSSGYEDVENILSKYTYEIYKNANDEEKAQMVNEIFEIYRGKNIFPIVYFNKDGVHDEIRKCIDKEVELKDNLLTLKFLQGTNLCRFLFPNLFVVEAGSSNNNSMYERFMNDHKLKRAIKLVFDMNKSGCVMPSQLRSKLELIGGNVATNFHPMKAKALYEKYCPENGIIYDFACGFGGRMLGALSSKKNYRYFGVEPCEETYSHLNELGNYIEDVTDRKNSFKIACCGSEDYCPVEEFADFAFSSPPYFNLERYSDEETQCYNKFSDIDSWFDGYVEPTIKNIYKMLKRGSYYAVNIADFNYGNHRVEYVDKWIELSIKCGFEYVEKISMKVQTRRGFGHKDENNKDKEKQEGIFVFKKV